MSFINNYARLNLQRLDQRNLNEEFKGLSLEIAISEDGFKAFLVNASVKDIAEGIVSVESLIKELGKRKITSGIRHEEITIALRKARVEKKDVENLLIARSLTCNVLDFYEFVKFPIESKPESDILNWEKPPEGYEDAVVGPDEVFAKKGENVPSEVINLLGRSIKLGAMDDYLDTNYFSVVQDGIACKGFGFLYWDEEKLHLGPTTYKTADEIKAWVSLKKNTEVHKQKELIEKWLTTEGIGNKLWNTNLLQDMFHSVQLKKPICITVAQDIKAKPIQEHVETSLDTTLQNPSFEKIDPKLIPSYKKNIKKRGDLLFKVVNKYENCSGETLDGKVIEPDYPNFENVENEFIKSQKGIAISDTYAFYYMDRDGDLNVRPLLDIDEEKMNASLGLFTADIDYKYLNVEEIGKILSASGIRYGFQKEKIRELIKTALREKSSLISKVIASGRKPQRAMVEKFIFNPEYVGSFVENEDDSGSVNWRESQTKKPISKDDIIGKYIPGQEAQDGIDIFGGRITPEKITEVPDEIGETLRHDEQHILSNEDGHLMAVKGIWEVLDILDIPGDVNFKTGNIKSNGTVNVKGGIQSGFAVEARGDLSVGQSIDSANIICGGDLMVGWGVNGSEKTFIKVGGDFKVNYMHHVNAQVDGELVAAKEVLDSGIVVKGQVNMNFSKARFAGGKLTIGADGTIKSLGTTGATKTIVEFSPQPLPDPEIDELKKTLKKKEALRKQLEEERHKKARDFAHKRTIDQLLNKIGAAIAEHQAKMKELNKKRKFKNVTLKCSEVFPGVIFKGWQSNYEILETKKNFVITFDTKQQGFVLQ